MWKRLNNPRGARNAGPTIDHLPAGDGYAGGYEDDFSAEYQNRRTPPPKRIAPLRPLRDNDMAQTGLPRLPFQPPQAPLEHRDSKFRPASSLYSQPSPNPILTRFHSNSYPTPEYVEEEEVVSPQSSPEVGPLKNRSQHQNAGDVSPIDEMPEVSHLTMGRSGANSRIPSSIPVARREKRRNSVAAAAASFVSRKEIGDGPKGRTAHDPRWDPYSGEITTSDRGKPQSVKPGSFTPPGLRPVHKETGLTLGNESIITAGTQQYSSFGDRVRRMKNESNTAAPVVRPEWKGATGRVAIVSPVADQLDMPPISIPRKSSRRVASPQSTSFSGSTSPVTIIRGSDDETDPASSEHHDPSITTMLSKTGRDSPRNAHSPITVNADPVEVSVSAAAKLARDNAPATWERDDGTMANIERNFREQLKTVNALDHYEQPASRFSVTTYAPSEAHSTPRPSTDTFDRPPMPNPPQVLSAAASPLLNRKRPTFIDSPKITSSVTRKAINPSSPVFISMSAPAPNPLNKRFSNVAKTLPMTPSEASSHDLVTSLQAQLDDLAHRRNNITRSIRQMTELMPKDSVMMKEDVRRKREMEKLKVEKLRAEEADVRREEHDIGLRLHRAWKRRDKDAVFEPTGLWVRRVTG